VSSGQNKNRVLDPMYNIEKIEIPMKPISGGPSQRQIPKDFKQTLQTEYATKYLEKIGATPTPDNIEYVVSNLPIADALVIPAWGRETLFIIPDRVNEAESTINYLFGENENKEDDDNFQASTNFTGTKMKVNSRTNVHTSGRKKSMPKLPPVKSTGATYEGMPPKYDHIRKVSRNTVDKQSLPLGLGDIHDHVSEFERSIFKQLLVPLDIPEEGIRSHVKNFNSALRDHMPKEAIREDELEAIRGFLASPFCVRFFGLLAHFAYWNMIHPFARRGLKFLKMYNKIHSTSNKVPSTNDLQHTGLNATDNTNSANTVPVTDGTEDDDDFAAKSMNGFRLTKLASFFEKKSLNSFDDRKKSINMWETDNDLHSLQSTESYRTLASEQSLTPGEKELIYLQLEECLQEMRKQIGLNVIRQRRSHHGLLSCSHMVVDNILLSTYVWLREVPAATCNLEGKSTTNLQIELRRKIHHAMSDILDPYKTYAASLLIPSMGEGGAAATSVAARMTRSSRADRGRYYTTSAAVRVLFTGSGASSTAGNEAIRKFLWLGSNHGSGNESPQRAATGTVHGTFRLATQERTSPSPSPNGAHRMQSPPKWNPSVSTRPNATASGGRPQPFSDSSSQNAKSKSPGKDQMMLDYKNLFASADKIHATTLTGSPTREQVWKQPVEELGNFPDFQIAHTMSFTPQEIGAVSTETKTQLMKLMVQKTKHFYLDKASGHPPHAYRGNQRLKLLSAEPSADLDAFDCMSMSRSS